MVGESETNNYHDYQFFKPKMIRVQYLEWVQYLCCWLLLMPVYGVMPINRYTIELS